MDKAREDAIIERARESYCLWAARPWYVKAWDRVRSECGYALYRLTRR